MRILQEFPQTASLEDLQCLLLKKVGCPPYSLVGIAKHLNIQHG